MDDPRALNNGLTLIVRHIANVFGARATVDDATMKECVRIAREKFKNLGLPEFVEAYRLWASERFPALEMYGGQFNATQFARVLAGYKKYRHEISQALAKEKNDAHAQAEAERRKAFHVAQYNRSRNAFPQTVQSVIKSDRYASPQLVPVHWYEFAEHNAMIVLEPGEKVGFCKRALSDIEQECAAKLEAKKESGDGIVALRSMIDHFQKTQDAAVFNRAKQYILWVKVFGRELPDADPTKTHDQ